MQAIITKADLDHDREFIAQLECETIDRIMRLSGQPRMRVMQLMRRADYASDLPYRKKLFRDFIPPVPLPPLIEHNRPSNHYNPLPEIEKMWENNNGPLITPIRLVGWPENQVKAGLAFEAHNHLRAERGRAAQRVVQHQRQVDEARMAAARFYQLTG